jgi:hypothetical protein
MVLSLAPAGDHYLCVVPFIKLVGIASETPDVVDIATRESVKLLKSETITDRKRAPQTPNKKIV